MSSPLHILFIEDNPADAEMVARLLRKEIASVYIELVDNKPDFVAALDRSVPDVIIADNSLPAFSASEALLILLARSVKIPFILVTGTVSEEFAANIIKMGANDYILKDRMSRLPAAIDAAIKQCRAENERMEAFDKLIESEEKYRNLIERITDGFMAIDRNWTVTYANKQLGMLAHRDPRTLIGKNLWEEFPGARDTATFREFHRAMKEQRYISHIDYFEPLDIWQENHIYPSPDGLSIFVRDITQKKKAEDEILEMNADLRELSSHLQNVREQERIRIAREIHDDLGQQLTGLKMDMVWLQKQLIRAPPAIIDKIIGSLALIDETVKSVRRIASDLRPSVLDDLGLIAALEWHAREVEKRSEIEVKFASNVAEIRVPSEVATGIFRIYQEVMTNAVRHSNARKIEASFTAAPGILHLKIFDNGKGMDPNAPAQKTLGLIGIKERAFILQGSIDIQSEPGKGTEVSFSVPYPEKS